MDKKILRTAIALAVLLITGLVAWYLWFKPQEPVACTADAKQCPDGSYVGRVPPRCEFAPCEGEFGTVTGKVAVGPLCSAEPCNGDLVDFSSRQVIFTGENGQKIFVSLSAEGNLQPTRLAPGTYQVTLSDCPWLGCEELPQTVTVVKDQIAEVLIDIDTGIR